MNDIHISNGYRLRPATMDEIPVIWEIILQAKAQMYREGKSGTRTTLPCRF